MNINWSELATLLLWRLLSIIITLILFFFADRFLLKWLKVGLTKIIIPSNMSQQRYDTLRKLFESIAHYILYFITGYIILTILGVPVATMIAGAGIAGLVIGLGAQSFVNDLVNGVFILIEKQFDIGDYVVIANVEGRVKSIGLRLTTIKGLDGSIYYIRNKEIVIVKNLTRNDTRVLINLFIPDAAYVTIIEETLKMVNDSQELVLEGLVKPTLIGLQTTPNGALYYSVALFTEYGQSIQIRDDFYKKYIHALQEKDVPVFQK